MRIPTGLAVNLASNHGKRGRKARKTDACCLPAWQPRPSLRPKQMRILAIDHGTKRMGIAVSDELKMIAQPLEFIPAEPFSGFLDRLKQLVAEKEVELILVGMPRNMDGSYGPAALKVQEFVTALKKAVTAPIKLWDERLTSAQANRFLIEADVSRSQRKDKVDKTAAALLLQSYLDSLAG
jgi:putative Holliday junction resolvase